MSLPSAPDPSQELALRIEQIVGRIKKSVEVEDGGDWPETPPLYHYTSGQGLLGIVRSRGIFAGDASCLNDRSELRHVDRALAQVGRGLDVRTEAGRLLKEQVSQGAVRVGFRIGAFVASFSEDADRLSQWRAYANDGLGYAIGVRSGTRLHAMPIEPEDDRFAPLDPWPAPFLRVVYDEGEQHALLAAPIVEIASLLDAYADQVTPDQAVSAVRLAVANIALVAEHLAPRIKNPGFSEEREWRAVVRFPENMYPGHKLFFRPSRHGLTASVLLQDQDEVGLPSLAIAEVVLGPKLDPVASPRTVKYMLRQTGYSVGPEESRPHAPLGANTPIRVWQSDTSYR